MAISGECVVIKVDNVATKCWRRLRRLELVLENMRVPSRAVLQVGCCRYGAAGRPISAALNQMPTPDVACQAVDRKKRPAPEE
jgi:hypothetical protein